MTKEEKLIAHFETMFAASLIAARMIEVAPQPLDDQAIDTLTSSAAQYAAQLRKKVQRLAPLPDSAGTGGVSSTPRMK